MNVRENCRLENRRVRATILKPDDKLSSLLPARHLIHLDHRYNVQTGHVLTNEKGARFLLVYHHTNRRSQVFLGLRITDHISVERFYEGINPATKMASGKFQAETFSVFAMREDLDPELVQKMTSTKTKYYTGQELKVSDKIDGKLVVMVKKVSGIYISETES